MNASTRLLTALSDTQFSVRRYAVHDGLSRLFSVAAWAKLSPGSFNPTSLLGAPAGMTIAEPSRSHLRYERSWWGICNTIECLNVEADGLSTYYIHLVPKLWLLTQARRRRIFEDVSIVDIVEHMFKEHGVAVRWQVDAAHGAKIDCIFQHGESDYELLARLLEHRNIVFTFDDDGTVVMMTPSSLRSHKTRLRHSHSPSDQFVASDVAVTSLRVRYAHQLAQSGQRPLHNSEVGATTTPVPVVATFEMFAPILWVGSLFYIDDYPTGDLSDHPLVAAELSISGDDGGSTNIAIESVTLSAVGLRLPANPRPDPKPVQLAVVTGPRTNDIYVDSVGRVRLEFPAYDCDCPAEHRRHTCWVRVGQSISGPTLGAITIPRIGQEVLVGFLGDDLDHPIIIGRVFNNTEVESVGLLWPYRTDARHGKPSLTLPRPLRLYISCADEDAPFRRELEQHFSLLQSQGAAEVSSRRTIEAGREVMSGIKELVQEADVFVILISPAFFEPDEILRVEVEFASRPATVASSRIVPIIVRPVEWRSSPFGRLSVLPDNSVPVSVWPNRDEAWLNVISGLRRVLLSTVAEPSTGRA